MPSFVLNCKTFTETFQMLQQAFEDECLSQSRYHEWFRFKEGRMSSADNPRSGRPSTSNDDVHVEKVKNLVRSSNHSWGGWWMQHFVWFITQKLNIYRVATIERHGFIGYVVGTKTQWSLWKSKTSRTRKKARQVKSKSTVYVQLPGYDVATTNSFHEVEQLIVFVTFKP